MSDAAIVELVRELGGDRANMVAHVVRLRLKALRLERVTDTVAMALALAVL